MEAGSPGRAGSSHEKAVHNETEGTSTWEEPPVPSTHIRGMLARSPWSSARVRAQHGPASGKTWLTEQQLPWCHKPVLDDTDTQGRPSSDRAVAVDQVKNASSLHHALCLQPQGILGTGDAAIPVLGGCRSGEPAREVTVASPCEIVLCKWCSGFLFWEISKTTTGH